MHERTTRSDGKVCTCVNSNHTTNTNERTNDDKQIERIKMLRFMAAVVVGELYDKPEKTTIKVGTGKRKRKKISSSS